MVFSKKADSLLLGESAFSLDDQTSLMTALTSLRL